MLYTTNLMLALILGIKIVGGKTNRAQDLSVSEVSEKSGETAWTSLILESNTKIASVDTFIRIADNNVAEFTIKDPDTGEVMVKA